MRNLSVLEDLAPCAELRPLRSVAVVSHGRRPPWSDYVGGLTLVAAGVVAAFGTHLATGVSPLLVAVSVGAVLANTGLHPQWARAGTHLAAKGLLRLGVVLLGFQLAVRDVLRLGVPGLAVVILAVATTFFGTRRLGRRLGVSPGLSLLIATGFSICGASAVAAMDGVSDADEEEVAFAIALVTLCGSLAIFVLPILAPPLGLHAGAFGTWVGASVHDVAQVVATASGAGAASLQAAVIVKLTRVALLAPMVAGITLVRRRPATGGAALAPRNAGDGDSRNRRPPVIPLFVALFLAAVALRSTGLLPAPVLGAIKGAETLSFAAALVGLGTGVNVAKLRRLGGRPLLLALASWAMIAVVSYVGIRLIGA
jgi:uncharacterized integral membrane protein (TIGR00698 family)